MSQLLLFDRPMHQVRSNAGKGATLGFLSVYNAVGTEFVVSNGIPNQYGIEKRVNYRYAFNSVDTPFLLTSG